MCIYIIFKKRNKKRQKFHDFFYNPSKFLIVDDKLMMGWDNQMDSGLYNRVQSQSIGLHLLSIGAKFIIKNGDGAAIQMYFYCKVIPFFWK